MCLEDVGHRSIKSQSHVGTGVIMDIVVVGGATIANCAMYMCSWRESACTTRMNLSRMLSGWGVNSRLVRRGGCIPFT